jgi:hypothetical protein
MAALRPKNNRCTKKTSRTGQRCGAGSFAGRRLFLAGCLLQFRYHFAGNRIDQNDVVVDHHLFVGPDRRDTVLGAPPFVARFPGASRPSNSVRRLVLQDRLGLEYDDAPCRRLRQLRAQRFQLGSATRELTQQRRLRDARALAVLVLRVGRRPGSLTFWLIGLHHT